MLLVCWLGFLFRLILCFRLLGLLRWCLVCAGVFAWAGLVFLLRFLGFGVLVVVGW